MAAEMIRAGGTGFIAANGTSTEHLRKEVDLAHRLLGHSSGRLPNLGIGILLWRLEQPGCSEAAETLIRLACEQASLLWLSFGVETERWVRLARQYAGSDIALCLIATSVESALEAARLGADYVIVQGPHPPPLLLCLRY
jgi:NAD(P)H-dependent flavin oxidoreductase YrpB (nitropropane dioxygenase family)